MLLHKEQYWLIGYVALVWAAAVRARRRGNSLWKMLAIGIGGTIVAFYGWLFQVGRFG